MKTETPLEQLVLKLHTQKVLLWVENGSLRYKAPKGSLTSALRDEIVAHKAELLAILEQSSADATSSSIQSIPRSGLLPLSFAQQRLWFLNQFEGFNYSYNIPIAWELSGSLNRVAIAQSLTEIVHRHESLRTNLAIVEGNPVQVIHPPQELTIPVIDLQRLPEAEKQLSVQRLALQEAEYSFNLADEPLLRVTLLQLAKEVHVLLLTMHHIISDGWSLGVLMEELSTLYDAFVKGQSSPLLPLPIQYVDFAHWQRNQQTMLDNQLAYWKNQLTGAPPLLELPTDHPRPPVQSFRGAQYKFELPSALNQALKSLSRETESTLFMVLYSVFVILLYRYSNQDDILVGTPIANRHRYQLEPLIGFFVNTLVLRVDLSENPTFQTLLAQVRQTTLEAYSHQDLPFELLVEALKPERNLSHSPVTQVLFSLQNTSKFHLNLPGLIVKPLEVARSVSKFDLSLLMEESEELITGEFEYSTDLFDASTIERMTGHFVTLLSGIVANPQQRIDQLPLLSESEQQQLLVEWNNTQVDYPQDRCIHQLFEEQVKRTPDAPAVVYENQQLTYQQLNSRANQLAHYLKSLGVGADVLVGICVERSIDMIVGLLGILKAGGAYVPLDPDYPTERLSFMLEDAQVPVLLTQQHLIERLPEYQTNQVFLDTDWHFIRESSQDNPIATVQATNLAYVIYTSGSTGKPKGAMNTHLGICNRLLWMQKAYQLTAVDCILQKTPFSFDVSVGEFFWPLLTGARLVVAKPGGHKDSAYLVNRILEQQVTTVHFVPSMLHAFIEEQSLKNCSSLKRVICSGEALPLELQERFFARLDCELHNLYGPTEAAIYVTFWQCKQKSNLRTVPIGRPIANTQIYILDSHLQPVPVGVAGELHISGAGLALGYLNRSQLTQEKFIPDPFSTYPSSRLYKTGDLARYLPDGNIEYLGRIDNQVKIRGFRIELGEIETVLSQHTHVHSAVVIAREDTPGDKRLVAYVVPQKEVTPTISELRQFVKAKLPEYMVPNAIVMVESLPLNPNGKVDRRALPKPDLDSTLLEKYVAPRTPIEEMLAQIWAQVLKVEQVGIHDNFFELGGHSLLATQLVSRIRNIFKVELPLRSLFAAATVAEFAQEIKQSQQQNSELSAPPILPRASDAQLPLSFAQQRLWFLDQLQPNSSFYNIPIALRLVGTLEVAALEQSLQEIIHRHEALCTNFITVDGKPVQIIQTQTNWTVSIVDLKHLSTTEQEIASQQLAQQQAIQPFNLATEPLVRATLVVLSETEHALLVCMHHIVSDGWSMGVFFQELASLYNAYSQGQPSGASATRTPLAPLPVQYADFAIWQRQWLQGDVLQSQLAYWQQQLASAPALLSLPTDRPRPAVQTFAGAYQEFALSQKLTGALTQLSQQQGVTLFMTLLAAFDTLLYRYTGQSDILVGSPIANRNRSEIEGLIGFFVNTLVLRTDLSENPSFKELLTRVREMALLAYAHQDLPFEMLVEALQPQRNLSRTPLFQVMFVFQNAPMSPVELTRLTVSPLVVESTTAKFDLTLSMENTATGLVGVWEYNTDLFDASTIERMTGHFVTLLSGIVANPQQRIDQLPLLSESEQQQLLVEWNNTQVDYPQDRCIHQLFEEQVKRTPDAPAVVYENQQLTYEQLNSRANQLAHYLKSLGVGADVLVGICVERSLEMVVGLLGILKAGGAYVPLDPTYPQERLQFMVEDAGVQLVLTQEKLVSTTHLPQVRQYLCLEQLLSQQATDDCNPATSVKPDQLAYCIYTSGSTGKPKGVQITHRNVVNFLHSMQQRPGLCADDTLVAVTTLSFDIAVLELFLPLIVGAKLVLATSEVARDGLQLSTLLNRVNATLMQATPATWRMLLVSGWQGKSNLRILCGGEELPRQLANELLPRTNQVWNMYGPTETTIWSTLEQVTVGEKPISIGRPIANTQIYILDQQMQLVPVGVIGDLYIGGEGVARGYLNRPQLTLERFIPHSFPAIEGEQKGRRLYKTGDKARYLHDGKIEFLGRGDDQVKIRGFRIELGEIEYLLSQHTAVREVVVVVREEPDGKRLVAYLVCETPVPPSELRTYLAETLPNYMIPAAFVQLEAFPLTPNGKINRRALPAPDYVPDTTTQVLPRTPTEEKLATIWQNVLGLEQVGIHDNFFVAGGHSLLATQAVFQIQQHLSVAIPLRSLFENPTIASLAEYIEASVTTHEQDIPENKQGIAKDLKLQGESQNGQSPLGRKTGEETVWYPLSYTQQQFILLETVTEKALVHDGGLFSIRSQVNIPALRRACQALINRHDGLRIRLALRNGVLMQQVRSEQDIPFEVIDASDWSVEQLTQQVEHIWRRLFDLKQEPPIRIHLLTRASEEYILVIVIHHIVTDAWSNQLIQEELPILYQAEVTGVEASLPVLPWSFTDYLRWQTEMLSGAEGDRLWRYWQQQLSGILPILNLPTDRPRPPVMSHRGAVYKISFSHDLTQQLRNLVQMNEATLYVLIQAAFQLLLHGISGQQDILVGTVTNNRVRKELERIVGGLVDVAVLRSRLSGNPTFTQYLSQIRENVLNVLAHQGYPLRLLAERLQVHKDPIRPPIVRVTLNYIHATKVKERAGQNGTDSTSAAGFNELKLEQCEIPIPLVGNWEDYFMLGIIEHKDSLSGIIRYNTDVFEETTIAQIAEAFQSLLLTILTNPEQPISELLEGIPAR